MKRRAFITVLGSAAAWPLAARAQQPTMPVVGFMNVGWAESYADNVAAFRKGLSQSGYVEGQNVTVEYHWLENQYDRTQALVADLVRRRVAVIVAPAATSIALAAKGATATIPIVFGVSEDPVKLGLVASLARPGGNATGVSFLARDLDAKRMGLLHELVPKAFRVAVLLNPTVPQVRSESRSPSTLSSTRTFETALEHLQEAARAVGLQLHVLHASTSREIDAAFATFGRERPDALFVIGDGLFLSRRIQLANLSARERIPTVYTAREWVAAGGLMSYGTRFADTFHQVGIYTGSILKGVKPADLPVAQSTKFEFVINLQTARIIGLDVPPTLLALADEIIE